MTADEMRRYEQLLDKALACWYLSEAARNNRAQSPYRPARRN
jgi:hypothetical protein